MIEFDLGIDTSGELLLDTQDYVNDVLIKTGNDLKIQLTYNRVKSCLNDWYMDKSVGANLESLIGRPCNSNTAEIGKTMIEDSLTLDSLWKDEDIKITAELIGNTGINYSILLRMYQGYSEEDIIIAEIQASLDLIKGVHVRYGWEPRR